MKPLTVFHQPLISGLVGFPAAADTVRHTRRPASSPEQGPMSRDDQCAAEQSWLIIVETNI